MSLPDHIQGYVGHTPTAATSSSSFFGDLLSFGSGLVDDIGESVGVIKDSYLNSLTGYAADIAANPATQQQYTNYADQHGNQVTQPQGQVPVSSQGQVGMMGFSNQQLMIGGIALLLLLILAFKK